MSPEFRVSARIAKPVGEVFDAVVDPKKLSGYFTTVGGASAPLVVGTTVIWWGKIPVEVDEIVANERIVLRWDGPQTPDASDRYKTRIVLSFEPLEDDATMVSISEAGWADDEAGLSSSYQNCEGWTQMLCCLKAYLEHGINLRQGMYVSELHGKPALETQR
jgi:uncharacterized protein YndB with AHSA1/START domain